MPRSPLYARATGVTGRCAKTPTLGYIFYLSLPASADYASSVAYALSWKTPATLRALEPQLNFIERMTILMALFWVSSRYGELHHSPARLYSRDSRLALIATSIAGSIADERRRVCGIMPHFCQLIFGCARRRLRGKRFESRHLAASSHFATRQGSRASLC